MHLSPLSFPLLFLFPLADIWQLYQHDEGVPDPLTLDSFWFCHPHIHFVLPLLFPVSSNLDGEAMALSYHCPIIFLEVKKKVKKALSFCVGVTGDPSALCQQPEAFRALLYGESPG